MYLRVEENIVVNTKDIIGIFDMDNTVSYTHLTLPTT